MSESNLLLKNNFEISEQIARAYFQQENYIPDNNSKAYNKDVEITLDSLKTLNKRVLEKFQIHEEYGLTISVDVKFEDRKTIHFGRWKEFEDYGWDETQPLNNIVLKWSFNAKFKGLDIPQKHTLLVKLSNGIRPEEIMNIIFSGNFSDVTEIDNNFFPVITQCTFTDRTFGGELIDLVEKWVESVTRQTWAGRKALKFLRKNRVKISKIVQWVTNIVIVFGTLFTLMNYLDSVLPETLVAIDKEVMINVIFSLCMLIIVWNMAGVLSRWFGKTMHLLITEYGHSYIFSITKSDKERRDKMQKENRYDKIKLCMVTLSNVVVNIFFILLERVI